MEKTYIYIAADGTIVGVTRDGIEQAFEIVREGDELFEERAS